MKQQVWHHPATGIRSSLWLKHWGRFLLLLWAADLKDTNGILRSCSRDCVAPPWPLSAALRWDPVSRMRRTTRTSPSTRPGFYPPKSTRATWLWFWTNCCRDTTTSCGRTLEAGRVVAPCIDRPLFFTIFLCFLTFRPLCSVTQPAESQDTTFIFLITQK